MRRPGAGKPRIGRFLFTAALVISMVTGAGLGFLTHQTEQLAFAEPIPTANRSVVAAIPFFVRPQPKQYTPYGTLVTPAQRGIPDSISLPVPARQVCDVATGSITRGVLILDAEGKPVSGVEVLFTVTRSDLPEPQLVGAITDDIGQALVTVLVPQTGNASDNTPVYQVVAKVATPAGSAEFDFVIDSYTCTSEVR